MQSKLVKISKMCYYSRGDFMKKQFQGTLYLVLATLIWGSTFVAQSVGMDFVGPFTFQATRCFLGVLVLMPVIGIADRFKNDGQTFLSRWKDKKLWKAGLLCGIPLFLACNLQQVGLVETDAGKAAFLTSMYIVFVPLVSVFWKKQASVWLWVSVPLAVAGLYFLSCAGMGQIMISDLMLIACALMFTAQILFVEKYVGSVDPLRLNAIQGAVCCALSFVMVAFTETPTWKAVADCWLPIGYAGILSMGIAYSLQIIGQKHLDSTPAAIIMSLESVVAVLCGWLILGERMTRQEGLGCILMFIAVILSQIPSKKKEALK